MEKASAKEVLNGHDDTKFVTPRGLHKFLLEQVYPVGSIYMSVNATDPGILFGGEWQWLKDRFLLGAGNTYTNGQTGGEATHKLTEAEMPTHKHNFNVERKGESSEWISLNFEGSAYPDYIGLNIGADWTSNGNINILPKGGDQPHNNMPPYLVVYMWKRVK